MGLIEQAAIGVSDALFSKTQRRVLSLLFGNPERNEFERLDEFEALTDDSGSKAVP
jgi:hypothetical protein